jgi:hypothetical protein
VATIASCEIQAYRKLPVIGQMSDRLKELTVMIGHPID